MLGVFIKEIVSQLDKVREVSLDIPLIQSHEYTSAAKLISEAQDAVSGENVLR